jgi:formamidopyrimidine-DNA glycosylase
MPELPDIIVYVESLQRQLAGRRLNGIVLRSAFVLRSVAPRLEEVNGLMVRGVRRIGKRLVLVFDADLFLVIHLMIAGRLRWRDEGQKPRIGARLILAQFEFDHGTLLLTEAGSKKRASIHLVRGESALRALDPGGLEPLEASYEAFCAAATRESHTLKRTLTDPHLFSGIGNAYSDEILHAARLSPLKLTRMLSDEECRRLYEATRDTLTVWIARLRRAAAGGFPEKVTAFHDEMAVHGRFGRACPACGATVQRIVYAENECNYCPSCQTGGRRLADRALSRLLK